MTGSYGVQLGKVLAKTVLAKTVLAKTVLAKTVLSKKYDGALKAFTEIFGF